MDPDRFDELNRPLDCYDVDALSCQAIDAVPIDGNHMLPCRPALIGLVDLAVNHYDPDDPDEESAGSRRIVSALFDRAWGAGYGPDLDCDPDEEISDRLYEAWGEHTTGGHMTTVYPLPICHADDAWMLPGSLDICGPPDYDDDDDDRPFTVESGEFLRLYAGGMDMSRAIAEAYIRLGYLPPACLDMPTFAGDPLHPTIRAAMARSYKVAGEWVSRRLERLASVD